MIMVMATFFIMRQLPVSTNSTGLGARDCAKHLSIYAFIYEEQQREEGCMRVSTGQYKIERVL